MMGINKAGAEWAVIDKWLRSSIAKAQQSLEVQGLDISRTEFLRGQINGWRLLIEDVESVPIETQSRENYV